MKLLLEDTTDEYGNVLIGYTLQNESGKDLLLRHMFTPDEVQRFPLAIALFRDQIKRNVQHFNRIHKITDEFFKHTQEEKQAMLMKTQDSGTPIHGVPPK